MNVLGVDYGEARTGLAWASSEVRLALPLEVVPSQDMDVLLKRICEVVSEREIDLVLVGLPLNMASKDSQQTEKVRDFVSLLQGMLKAEVKMVDERFTSQLATRYLEKGQSIDIESARIIIEEWLEQHE